MQDYLNIGIKNEKLVDSRLKTSETSNMRKAGQQLT
jgi:hypothetical protein